MQEQIINGLLSAVVAAAAIFLFLKERSGEDRLNRKQKKMLIRILVSAMLLLALQLVTAEDPLSGSRTYHAACPLSYRLWNHRP